MIAAQELTEAALAASTADGCIVVLEEHSEANLRWAANAITTSGHATSRTLTVISLHERAAGRGVGIASRSATSAAEAVALARAADAAARESTPVEPVSPLVAPYPVADDWAATVRTTGPRRSPRSWTSWRRPSARGGRPTVSCSATPSTA